MHMTDIVAQKRFTSTLQAVYVYSSAICNILNHMKKLIYLFLAATLLAACSGPNGLIVTG